MQAAGLKGAFMDPNLGATLFAPTGALSSVALAEADNTGCVPSSQAPCPHAPPHSAHQPPVRPCLRFYQIDPALTQLSCASPSFRTAEAAWQRFYNDCKHPPKKAADVAKYCSQAKLLGANKAELQQVGAPG